MKLYMFPVAPNPTKVRLYLAEKQERGGTIEVEEVRVNLLEGEQNSPEHRARNPLGRLPVLELDDGSTVIESLAIIEYLEECFPEPTMLGRTPVERARTRDLERIADLGVLGPVATFIHATRSPLGHSGSKEVAERALQTFPRSLRVLEEHMADGRPFLAGGEPTTADCTLAAAFQFARFRELEIDPAFERLADWDRRFRERPSARRVLDV